MPSSSMLTCTNLTRDTLIANQVKKADTYFSRLLGLLPKRNLEPGEGLWIVPCRDIHSIGMRFAFDAIFMDADLKVVYLIERMPGFRVSPFIRQACSVLELDAGMIAKTNTQVGDQLQFKSC